MTVQGLQAAGVPPGAAQFMDDTAAMVATMGANHLNKIGSLECCASPTNGNIGFSNTVLREYNCTKEMTGTVQKIKRVWARTNRDSVNQVIKETIAGRGNFTSQYCLSSKEVLTMGEQFLGSNYKEIGKAGSGVFGSADRLRQFRMDANSIRGNHNPWKTCQ